MPSAEELHRRGVAAYNRGRHEQARSLFELALADLPEPDLVARIEVSMAYVLAETGEAKAALDLCRRASARRGVTRSTLGIVRGQTGLLMMLQGQGDEALAAFGDAIDLLEDKHELGRVHLNRGGVYLQRHQLQEAGDDFLLADAAYVATGDDYGSAKAVHNLGYVKLLAGDLVDALEIMGRAYAAFAEQGPVMTAMADQDRAEALLAAGLVHEGRAALSRAANAYGRRHLYQRKGEAEHALARTLVDVDPAAALAAARRAGRLFDRSGTPVWRDRANGVALTAEVNLGRATPRLLTRGAEIAELLRRHKLLGPAANAQLMTARVLIRRGDLAAARDLLSDLPRGRHPLDVRLLERDVRAELAHASGRSSSAFEQLRVGLSELHDWQSSFGSLDLQTNVVAHGVALAKRGLAIAVEARSDAVLFEWSERARMLASRVQPVRAPQDAQSVADLTELRAGPTPEREAELRQRIRERAWQTKGSGQVADPVTLDELQEALAEGTALVAYVVTADRVVALVVTSEGSYRHDLGERAPLDALLGGLLPDLEVASSELPAAMATVVRAELADRVGDLGRLLVEPLLDDLGDRRLVLTPSGVLAGVPWTLLPGLAGRPLTVAQSATSWLARRATPLRADTAGLVAGPRVARAEAEVSAAAAAWSGAKTLTGEAATAGAVSELAGEVDVLHLAAHGKHSSENPLFSGVQLADGAWFGYDIDQLTAVPDIVILSACEVGRSSVRAGEELIGMTAAWMHAGARCVIASAASVSDDVAHDVLTKVHAQLAKGIAPEVALAEAVPAVDAERPPAPFVCFG